MTGPQRDEIETTVPGNAHHIYTNTATGAARIGEPIARIPKVEAVPEWLEYEADAPAWLRWLGVAVICIAFALVCYVEMVKGVPW